MIAALPNPLEIPGENFDISFVVFRRMSHHMECDKNVFGLPKDATSEVARGQSRPERPPDRVPSKSVDERIYLEEPAPTAFTSIGSTESVVNLASPINPFVVSVGGQARTI